MDRAVRFSWHFHYRRVPVRRQFIHLVGRYVVFIAFCHGIFPKASVALDISRLDFSRKPDKWVSRISLQSDFRFLPGRFLRDVSV